jgi:carbon storage regulator
VIVITRKVNEQIMIGDQLSIMVVEIKGDMVRLGIEAPREVPVHRGEIYRAIHRNSPRALHDAPAPDRVQPRAELSSRHAALLDRLAAEAAGRLGRPITRDQMLAAILDAVGELDLDWSRLERLEGLPPLLLSAAAEHADRDGRG